MNYQGGVIMTPPLDASGGFTPLDLQGLIWRGWTVEHNPNLVKRMVGNYSKKM